MKILNLEWEYEDCLPRMDKETYDLIYPSSRIRDGVRMFPYVIAPSPDETPAHGKSRLYFVITDSREEVNERINQAAVSMAKMRWQNMSIEARREIVDKMIAGRKRKAARRKIREAEEKAGKKGGEKE